MIDKLCTEKEAYNADELKRLPKTLLFPWITERKLFP